MSIPSQLGSDRFFRRAILLGVVLVLGGSVGSQLLMQLGGSPRHEPLDFSEQLPEALKGVAQFPDGLPPFISSGGLYYPDKVVFGYRALPPHLQPAFGGRGIDRAAPAERWAVAGGAAGRGVAGDDHPAPV